MPRRNKPGEGAGGGHGLTGRGLLRWVVMEFLSLTFPHGTLIVRTANHRTMREDWGDPLMVGVMIETEADAPMESEEVEEAEPDDKGEEQC